MLDPVTEIPEWFLTDDNRVSLYSSVRIVRNFKNMNFPDQADISAIRQIGRRTDSLLEKMIMKGVVQRIDLASADPAEIIRLQKFRILPKRNMDILSRMKLYHHSTDDSYLITCYNDHFTFFAHSGGIDIDNAYKRCCGFLDLFDRNEFASDDSGNFLTSSLDYFGTGLKCFSVLTIPAIRLFGSATRIIEDLKSNGIRSSGYFSKGTNELTIISGKDSVSKASAGTAEHFAEVLQEFDKICRETSESKITELADLKTKCERIFNYEFLTFKDFMEIYYILSFAAGANRSKGMVSELNGQLAELLMSLQGTGPDEMIGPKVTARMKETAEKLLKGKIK